MYRRTGETKQVAEVVGVYPIAISVAVSLAGSHWVPLAVDELNRTAAKVKMQNVNGKRNETTIRPVLHC